MTEELQPASFEWWHAILCPSVFLEWCPARKPDPCLRMCRLLTRKERRAKGLYSVPRYLLPACEILPPAQRDALIEALRGYAMMLA